MNEIPIGDPCPECKQWDYHSESCSMYQPERKPMTAKIGCIALAFFPNQSLPLLGIECSKGRGFIMPGGKWEPGETLKDAARRELTEETTLVCAEMDFLFGGMSEEGYYTYSFRAVIDPKIIESVIGIETSSGKVRLGSWKELLQSKFGGYYEVLKEVIENGPVSRRRDGKSRH